MTRRDAADVADGTRLAADVCVIGSGPAGIATARSLEADGASVVLLESGGEGAEPGPQAMAAGPVVGAPLGDLGDGPDALETALAEEDCLPIQGSCSWFVTQFCIFRCRFVFYVGISTCST